MEKVLFFFNYNAVTSNAVAGIKIFQYQLFGYYDLGTLSNPIEITLPNTFNQAFITVSGVKYNTAYTVYLQINNIVVSQFDTYYGGSQNNDFMLFGFCHGGDKIRLSANGDKSNFYIRNIIITPFSFHT